MNLTQLLITVVTVGGIYALLALALNLQLGYTGLINFGIVAYFAAGAYAYVVLVQPPPSGFDTYLFGFGLPIWVGLIGACAAGALFALITGWPCLRLRGEYLALTTFAFAEVLGSLITNADSITNGTLGFTNLVQPLEDAVAPEDYGWLLAGLVAAVVVIVYLFIRRLTGSSYGNVLKAVRDDELAAVLAGKRVKRLRLQSFVIGAVVSGLAGAIYTWYTTVASPGLFSADITFTVFIILTLGGIGSNLGAVLGAFILIAFQETVRGLATNPVIAQRVGSVVVALEGLMFLVVLRYFPGGAAEALTRLRHRWSGRRNSGAGEGGTGDGAAGDADDEARAAGSAVAADGAIEDRARRDGGAVAAPAAGGASG